MPDDMKVYHYHVGTVGGYAFAVQSQSDPHNFAGMVKAAGYVQTQALHIPYAAIAFIGLAGETDTVKTADIIHLVPKEPS